MASVRFVAIGDSFTEGVGDELPDGRVRGWADLVAHGWADATGEPVEYANLAIRGKLVWPIIEQQLEPALALKPTHLSFNGGGNDMLRPRTSVARIVEAFDHVMRRCDEEGVQLILLSGANPSPQLPLGRVFQRRGDVLSAAVAAHLSERPDIVRAFNWPDRELSTPGVLVRRPPAHECSRASPRRGPCAHVARLRAAAVLVVAARSAGAAARRDHRPTTASTSARGCAVG